MTVAKGGLKLRPTEEGSCIHVDPTDLSQRLTPGGKPWCLNPRVVRSGGLNVYDVHGMTLGVFARFLHPDGLPVIDRTGITGAFDIHFEWENDASTSTVAAGGAANDVVAILEQLGLRVDHGRGKREFLVIDRIARPSGN